MVGDLLAVAAGPVFVEGLDRFPQNRVQGLGEIVASLVAVVVGNDLRDHVKLESPQRVSGLASEIHVQREVERFKC